ncbi:NAD(P)-dependent oxidoreductase [Streptomyces sp. RPA4-2]|uniref:NAD(P)-dependent oxidoreductase n=1 Tax=Streptomyces sp. RPA4-2 TaxID=2721244 RepID=UPI00143E7C00|nr:NAD(P)-dependent oxidoreductase [Streptomyces sp. RPA4-2]QIY66149.1 dihydrofolate reductase [Streptomyces sp. RPA4-2]
MTASFPQVWLTAQFGSFTDLPRDLNHARWGGRSVFPADPADAEFYVPPLTQDIDIIGKPVARMTRLRVVQALSSGTDELRAELDRIPRDVTLCNARGVPAGSTAELALTLILASLRGIPELLHDQDREAWRPRVFPSLYERSVLIVGYGTVGSAPKDGALLVNVSRGAVVDTGALLKEAHGGRLRAALDVTDPEPLPAGHPLWGAPGVLITPHVGAFTPSLWPRLEELVRRQLTRFAAGEELDNVVAR